MTSIFISYAREDEAAARQIAERAKAKGFKVWWDRKLLPGDEFASVIEQRILAADRVIVIWSRTSVRSRWVKDEADLAVRHSKLVPICIDDSEPPLGFRSYNIRYVNNWDTDFKNLLDAMDPRVQVYTAIHVAAGSGGGEREVKSLLAGMPTDVAKRVIKSLASGGYIDWATVRAQSNSLAGQVAGIMQKAVDELPSGSDRSTHGRKDATGGRSSRSSRSNLASAGPAPIGDRFLAWVIDALIVAVITAVVLTPMSMAPGATELIPLLTWVIYHVATIGVLTPGATPGYSIAHTRVLAKTTRTPPDYGRIIAFALVRMFPFSLMWYFVGSGKRMLHDIASDTVVVKAS